MLVKHGGARGRRLLVAMQRVGQGLRSAATPTTSLNAASPIAHCQLSTASTLFGHGHPSMAPTNSVLSQMRLIQLTRHLSSSSSTFASCNLPSPESIAVNTAHRTFTAKASLASLSPLEKLREKVKRDPSILDIPLPYVGELPTHERLADGSEPAERDTGFRVLGLRQDLLKAVEEGLRLEEPTEIQEKAIPAILEGKDVLLGSHTGSGKTLAYLLPVIQALKEDEQAGGFRGSRPRRPRAIVLGPTRELTEQVSRVAKSLSHHTKFSCALIAGGHGDKDQAERLNSSVDLLVGSPGRLLQHAQQKHLFWGDVKYLVLDEADTMFDKGFGPEVKQILGPFRNRGGDLQVVLVTATLTKAVKRLLEEEFPGIVHVTTSSMNKKVSTCRHDFLPVAGNLNKMDVLVQVASPAQSRGQRVMVFSNTVSSCRAAEHYLKEAGLRTVSYHGEVPSGERIANLEAFRTGQPVKAPKQDSWEWEEEPEEDEPTIAPILVASDLAARGLDLEVDLVVNFDFPKNPVDYLHRSGRTARNGAKGRVTSLVTSRDRVLADQIRDAISRGESLEQLSSNKVVAEGMKKKRIEENRKEKERAARVTPVGRPKKVLVAPLTVRGRKTPPGRGGGIGVAKKVEQTRTAKNRGSDDKRPPVIPKGTRGAARAVAMGKPVEYKSRSRFARSAARR